MKIHRAKSDSECIANINKLYENGIDKPIVNIRADFQLLAKTAEYKNYAMLEDVQLGDIVTVINNKMNFNKKATVISYKWDCLLDKYNTVELGDFVKDITQSITSGEKAISSAVSANTTVKQVYSMISGNITIVNDTLYICIDSKDYTTANKLFKWGVNGLQFSSVLGLMVLAYYNKYRRSDCINKRGEKLNKLFQGTNVIGGAVTAFFVAILGQF